MDSIREISVDVWLVAFKKQLAWCAVQHDLNVWTDAGYKACVQLFLETAKLN